MAKVLIATVFGHSPVMRTVAKFGTDKLILLADDKGGDIQKEAIAKIQESLGKVVTIEIHKTAVYDVYSVAQKCVSLLEEQSDKDEIIVNVSSGRKPKVMGLLFACYARPKLVKKMVYVVEETNEILTLPKISFNVSAGQRKVLAGIKAKKYKTIEELAKKADVSRPTLYRHLEELMSMDLIEKTDEGYMITDAGRMVLL